MGPDNSQTLYVSLYGEYVYKTVDGGAIWSYASSGLPEDDVISVEDLAIDPVDPQIVYASVFYDCFQCDPDSGVGKSIDGGASWTTSQQGLETENQYEGLVTDPVDHDVVYTFSGETCFGCGGVYKSIDGGTSWTKSSSGLPNEDGIPLRALLMSPSDSSVLYATLLGRAFMYKSSDGAASWDPMATGLSHGPLAPLAVDPSDPSVMYAGAPPGGVFKSTTGGSSWRRSVAGFSATDTGVIALAPSDSSVAYVAVNEQGSFTAGRGLYRTIDGGQHWRNAGSGLPRGIAGPVSALAVHPASREIAYAAVAGSGVYSTTDGGESWAPTGWAFDDRYVAELAFDPLDPDTLYAAPGLGLFKSTDGGESWTEVDSGLGTYPHVRNLGIDPKNPQVLYASSQDSSGPMSTYTMYKSVDGGLTWAFSNSGLPEDADVWSVSICTAAPAVLYIGTSNGVYVSNDGGSRWRRRSMGHGWTGPVLVDPTDPSIAYAALDGRGVFWTKDGGFAWHLMRRALTSPTTNSLVITPDGSELMASSTGGGVFTARVP
jgi:photosystem II stability/assembly factor-like uncharacterized protein